MSQTQLGTTLSRWGKVEKPPELRRLEIVLDTLPDEGLREALESVRGRGRNDYPVRAMWRALVARPQRTEGPGEKRP